MEYLLTYLSFTCTSFLHWLQLPLSETPDWNGNERHSAPHVVPDVWTKSQLSWNTLDRQESHTQALRSYILCAAVTMRGTLRLRHVRYLLFGASFTISFVKKSNQMAKISVKLRSFTFFINCTLRHTSCLPACLFHLFRFSLPLWLVSLALIIRLHRSDCLINFLESTC